MIKTRAARWRTGEVWEDKGYTGISQIFISYKPSQICSVQFQYVDGSGNLLLSPLRGRDDGTNFSVIHVDYQRNEFLIGLAGHYGKTLVTGVYLHSLTFETDKRKYGPFGGPKQEDDVSFDIQLLGDGDLNQTFGGFHGTSCKEYGLIPIGLFVKARVKPSLMGSSDDEDQGNLLKSNIIRALNDRNPSTMS